MVDSLVWMPVVEEPFCHQEVIVLDGWVSDAQLQRRGHYKPKNSCTESSENGAAKSEGALQSDTTAGRAACRWCRDILDCSSPGCVAGRDTATVQSRAQCSFHPGVAVTPMRVKQTSERCNELQGYEISSMFVPIEASNP